MRPLCVSLLGQGGDAFAELNTAVHSITTRFAAWSPGVYDKRIAEVDGELDAERRSLAKIDTELRSLREEETYPHSLMNGTYAGTASAIAQRVAIERERFGWLQLPRQASDDPPLTNADMATWLRIRRTYDDDSVNASKFRVVGTDKLPTPADFAIAVTTEREAKAEIDRIAGMRMHPAYRPVVALNARERANLAEKLRETKERRKYLRRLGHDWIYGALSAALEGRQARWQALLDHSWQLIGRIDQLLVSLGSSLVSLPETWDLAILRTVRADAAAVLEHLKGGGKWTTFAVFTPKAVKDRTYLRQITVDGQLADTRERLQVVCDYIDLVFAFNELEAAWSDHNGLPSGSQLRIRVVAIKEHVGSLGNVLDYAQACLYVSHHFSAATPVIPEPNWINDEADEWLELFDASVLEERRRLATEQVTACLRDLKAARDLHDTHPVVALLIKAVEQREITAYSQAHQQVGQIEQTRRDNELRWRIETALGPAVPGLIGAVMGSVGATAWDERFDDWEHAWRWAVADNWLGKRADVTYRQHVWERRHDTNEAIGRLLAEAAVLRAWTHFFNRLSPAESAALKSWREAVRAMGKATGRSARMETTEARSAAVHGPMSRCDPSVDHAAVSGGRDGRPCTRTL